MVRASTLISVQWPPAPISAGPDTLVLSVGTYYVDLRIDRDDGSIYWALAGRRIVVCEEPRKVKFTHEIDSHSPSASGTEEDGKEGAEEIADEGTFTKLPNGDDLEVGEMPAPHLGGKLAAYREVWRELDPGLEDNNNSEDGESTEGKGNGTCWMLESLDTEGQGRKKKKRTFYCRVGRFFLAIRRTEKRVSDQKGVGVEVEFSGIRQEEETRPQADGGKEWIVKYSVGSEVDDMFHMSRAEFVLENTTSGGGGGALEWEVDDRVIVKNKTDGTIREVCVVRAVN